MPDDGKTSEGVGMPEMTLDEFPRESLIFPENLWTDMAHLESLGLAEIIGGTAKIIDSSYQRSILIEQAGDYQLMPWGKRLIRACTPAA